MVGDFAVADIVMGAVVVVSAVFGLMRGFLREVLSLVIWAAALLAGRAFARPVGALLGLEVGTGLQTAVGFTTVFLVVVVCGAIVQRVVGRLVDSTGLSGTDRTLGLVFGTARGALIVLVALIMLRPFVETREWWQTSRLAPVLLSFEEELVGAFNQIMAAVMGSPETPLEPV